MFPISASRSAHTHSAIKLQLGEPEEVAVESALNCQGDERIMSVFLEESDEGMR